MKREIPKLSWKWISDINIGEENVHALNELQQGNRTRSSLRKLTYQSLPESFNRELKLIKFFQRIQFPCPSRGYKESWTIARFSGHLQIIINFSTEVNFRNLQIKIRLIKKTIPLRRKNKKGFYTWVHWEN